jgi:hypothetical protein
MRYARIGLIAIMMCGTLLPPAIAQEAGTSEYQYRVLATTKTRTMQEELNQAGRFGFRLESVMGGETSFGGDETVVVMSRPQTRSTPARYEYMLLATSRTSTMQRERQEAGDEGFRYVGQTVFETSFGGKEVVVIVERDPEASPVRYEYKLLATSRTSTMEKELTEPGLNGFAIVGLTVSKTKFGLGKSELVAILRRHVTGSVEAASKPGANRE